MVRRQLVNLGGFGCEYRIGCGALDEFSRYASGLVGTPRRAALVLEPELDEDVVQAVSRGLIDAGYEVHTHTFKREMSVASLAAALELQDFLAASHVTRDDAIVSVGGMEVASVVDYVAYSWCGGTSCGHVPTTLDAMCLAATRMLPLACSDGGARVSFNPHVSLVVCDLDLVMSQPLEERALGLAYMVGAAMTESKRSWDKFADKIPGCLAAEELAYIDMLGMSQTAWSGVLKASNPSARAAFGYGLTTARALKLCLGDTLTEAQLLSEGLRFEARLAHEVFDLDIDAVFEQDDRLDDLGIEEAAFAIEPARFISALHECAFARSNRFMFSLPKAVGTVRLSTVDDAVLERHAEAYLASRAELLED